MNTIQKAQRLRNMLSQVTHGDVTSAVKPESAEGFGMELLQKMDSDPVAAAGSGVQKLAESRLHELTNAELFSLEAIVMPLNRPVVFARGQSYDDVPGQWASLNTIEVKARISKLFPLIGRIELPLSAVVPYAGTGFVVGDGLLMTNRHIAELFSQGLGTQIRYRSGASAVDFKRQVDTPPDDQTEFLRVVGVEMIHPYWDMALLRVDGFLDGRSLPILLSTPEELVGRNVVVVGYPARDSRNDLDIEDRVFQKIYNVKRVQPGIVRPRGPIVSFENTVNAMIHDASTLGGNSGSAIIDVETGQVIGLHFGGEYLLANYAVPIYELACDKRVAPLLGIEGKVKSTTLCDAAWQTVSEETSKSLVAPPQPRLHVSEKKASVPLATFTVPLQVTISLGTPTVEASDSHSTPVTSVPSQAVEFSAEAVPAPDFELARAVAAFIPLLQASYALAAQAPFQLPAGYTRIADVRVGGAEAFEVESTLTPEQQRAVEHDGKALIQGATPTPIEGLADPSAFGFVVKEDATGAILISIRGTQTPAEWLADFTPVPVPFFESPSMGLVHVGFAFFYHKVRASIQAALNKIDAGARITVLGHSLGGAMSVLCAADIERNMGRKNVDLCTFGGPRTGKIDFRINFNHEISKCFRIVNALDIVPHVPSVITGWSHVGAEIDVSGKGAGAHSLEAYLDGLKTRSQPRGNEKLGVGQQVMSIRVL